MLAVGYTVSDLIRILFNSVGECPTPCTLANCRVMYRGPFKDCSALSNLNFLCRQTSQ